jgi:hypothetical protein
LIRKPILSAADLEAFVALIRAVKIEGKKWVAEFKQKQESRGLPQNRLMWMWLTCIQEETGTGKKDSHHFFKEKFLAPEIKVVFGKEIEIPPSTANLDTKQFSVYLDSIRLFALEELAIHLPLPEERGFDEFEARYGDWR